MKKTEVVSLRLVLVCAGILVTETIIILIIIL